MPTSIGSDDTVPAAAVAPWTASDFAARLGTWALICSSVVAFLYLVDPYGFGWGANATGVLKYLPVEIAVLAQVCFWLSRQSAAKSTSRALVLFALFCGIVLTGSLVTLLYYHAALEDSFLGRGLALLPLFPAFTAFSKPREAKLLTAWLRVLVLLASIIITMGLIIWAIGIRFVDQPHIYHEELFVPVSATLMVYTWKSGLLRSICLSAFLCSGLASLKNTGFLATAIIAALLAALLWKSRGSPLVRAFKRTVVLASVLATVLVAGAILIYYREVLPSGSPAVRAFTYSERILRFIDHPITGSAFVGSPLLSLFRQDSPENLYVPSHSDLLDILSFGGLLGLALFIAPLASVLIAGFRRLSRHVQVDWLTAFSVGVLSVFIMEMAFNPVWNQPALVLIFCLAFGFLLAARPEESHPR